MLNWMLAGFLVCQDALDSEWNSGLSLDEVAAA
jgi:hypothetical protein